jgi:hypothetical protein
MTRIRTTAPAAAGLVPGPRGGRPASALQRAAALSPATRSLDALQRRAGAGPSVAQRAGLEEEELQMQAIQRTAVLEEEELQLKAVQRAAGLEEEEPLQGKLVQRQPEERRAQAATGGLPDDLRAGVEALSGIAMDGVRVHYDSPKPAQLAAHAYAQGSEIHLAPGQQQHLPHEAWHVVQQSQGRVAPTATIAGAAINDDPALEHEADVMGAQAARQSAESAAQRMPEEEELQLVQRRVAVDRTPERPQRARASRR